MSCTTAGGWTVAVFAECNPFDMRGFTSRRRSRADQGLTEPESPCIGAMIEPMSPETHDVNAPGLLLRGVRWG